MKITNDIRSILNQDNWIKGSYAQDINGNKVSAVDPTACKFCLSGACFRLHLKTMHIPQERHFMMLFINIQENQSVFSMMILIQPGRMLINS